MRISGRKGPMGITGWLLLIFILGLFAWMSRRQLTNAAAGHLPPSKNSVAGEWVGTVDITDGYKQYVGDTPGKHTKAAIRFTLVMYDSFVERYAGKGEITIQGEAQPRQLHITKLQPDDNGRIGGTMVGDWGYGDSGKDAAGHTIKGWFKPNELSFGQTDGLEFHGVLHKGTDADYEALCKILRKES